jgi:hypothetical protein
MLAIRRLCQWTYKHSDVSNQKAVPVDLQAFRCLHSEGCASGLINGDIKHVVTLGYTSENCEKVKQNSPCVQQAYKITGEVDGTR